MVPVALKSSQPFWQSLIRPMLLMSLGLHGLLLFTPTPSKPPEPPAEEKIKLTQLPAENQPVVAPTPARPTPAAIVVPKPRAAIAPIPRRVDAPPPLRSTISRPVTPPPAQATPRAAASPPASPPASPTASPPAPPADAFTAGFPIYRGSQPGSFGLPSEYESASKKTNDGMDQVDSFFQTALADGGYAPTAIEQPGRSVYQVTKGGQTRYLTLIPNQDGEGTNIVLSNQPLPENLGNGSVESPAVGRFYTDLASAFSPDWQNDSDQTQPLNTLLSDPTSFYSTLGGESTDETGQTGYVPPEPRAGYVRGVVATGDPQTVYATIQSGLQQFDVQPQGSYGGGTVYQLKRTDVYSPTEPIVRYLILVPTVDGAKTFVFIWDRPPSP